MSYTWDQALQELRRLLGDTGAEPTFSSDLLLDGYNHALQAFTAHTAVASASGWNGDGLAATVSIPDNCLEDLPFVYLWDETNEVWWKPIDILPGRSEPDPTIATTSNSDYTYFEWPKGTIRLSSIPDAGDEFLIYYFAYWDPIVDTSSVIVVPHWAREALLVYAAAYAIDMQSIRAAGIRQWNNKEDSGVPEQNPMLRMREALMKQYDAILARHPIQDKVVPFTSAGGL